MKEDFGALTIRQLHQGLVDKDFSAVELCNFYLDEIEAKDKKIGAFLQVSREMALNQAREVDYSIFHAASSLSVLAGIPCAIKDNILIKGLRCTAGSKILKDYNAVYNATCIERLLSEKVVFLGKTNLDEFAMGSSTENSAFKITKNPIDLTRVPGGTSGGSAAAVASDQCVFALGSDTGGSIRQPASFCGVVGLKPTYGAVSRYGLVAYASSLDQIGPLARTVDDCEIVFNAIVGKDPRDSTSADIKSRIKDSELRIKNLRIGIPKEYFAEGLDREVGESVKKVIKLFEKEGADVIDVSLPNTKYALPCYYIIAPSEASANLARFDGIRYGKSEIKNIQSGRRPNELKMPGSVDSELIEVYTKTREKGFGPEVKRRIMLGTFVLSSGYYDAYYLRAQKVRTLIRRDFEDVFRKVDFILTPVSPFLPFKLGEKIEDPLKMYLSDIYTVSVNLAGLPALSMPVGKINELSVGLQLIARPFDEQGIFAFAKIIEQLVSSQSLSF